MFARYERANIGSMHKSDSQAPIFDRYYPMIVTLGVSGFSIY